MQSFEEGQSESNRKENAAKANPRQALVALLLAFNASEAFTSGGLTRHAQGMDARFSRGGVTEMIEAGSKVRVLRPGSGLALGTVVDVLAEGDSRFGKYGTVVVRLDEPTPSGAIGKFALDELDELEASPSRGKGMLDLNFGTGKVKPPPTKTQAKQATPFHLQNPLADGYVIFSAPGCKFCDLAKQLLQKQGHTYVEKGVDTLGGARAEMKFRLPDETTIPQIYLDNNHIGGWTDLQSMLMGPRGVIEEAFGPPRKERKQGFV